MNKAEIAEAFYSLIFPSHPNEWEIEEIIDELSVLPTNSCEELLSHVPSVWPVSNSLCCSYLKFGAAQFQTITQELLPEWVRWLLSQYEAGGLREAEVFMSDADANFIQRLQSTSEVKLEDINCMMSHYIHGVSGSNLIIEPASQIWSDTESIFLPASINIYPDKSSNLLLYKFLVSYQWSLIYLKSNSFIEKVLTEDGTLHGELLIKVYLLCKGFVYIKKNLPGLWRRAKGIIAEQLRQEALAISDNSMGNLIEKIADCAEDQSGNACCIQQFFEDETPLNQEFSQFKKLFKVGEEFFIPSFFRTLLGHFDTCKTRRKIEEKRAEQKESFISMLSKKLPQSQDQESKEPHGDTLADQGVTAITISRALEKADQKHEMILRINNQNVILPQELLELAANISKDLGGIPDGYIQAAMGIASQGKLFGDGLYAASATETEITTQSAFIYDEWDCRRGGYRKNWCTLLEEELPPQQSNFIEQTLIKYTGLRKQIRRQFEMMQTSHRLLGRQRDGDELDVDAIIDSIGNRYAGKASSERLFIRLQRNQRSIATLFMVDMSNSTSGWIGNMIKESLVLLCEAMETLGDQYGIYGFSGMRRSRCKLYPIKHLGEPYNTTVQDRIAAISPKDYTRMAPFIRHLTDLLEKVDVKTRLLISLSDGKPEDYDGYHGTYAIEDTKKALLEARGRGITPFCITIDKQAHDYLDHMYGVGSYCFINRIDKLPFRMPQIYRNLTK